MERICRCGTTFTPKRKDQVHCSSECRKKAHRAKRRYEIICSHLEAMNEELVRNGYDRFGCNCPECHPDPFGELLRRERHEPAQA